MTSIADEWMIDDRRDLFCSLTAITSEDSSADRIGLCLDTILNDLELYEDPRQGAGLWLYENELHLADQLGAQLHDAVGDRPLPGAAAKPIASSKWIAAQATAVQLVRLMAANGDYTR